MCAWQPVRRKMPVVAQAQKAVKIHFEARVRFVVFAFRACPNFTPTVSGVKWRHSFADRYDGSHTEERQEVSISSVSLLAFHIFSAFIILSPWGTCRSRWDQRLARPSDLPCRILSNAIRFLAEYDGGALPAPDRCLKLAVAFARGCPGYSRRTPADRFSSRNFECRLALARRFRSPRRSVGAATRARREPGTVRGGRPARRCCPEVRPPRRCGRAKP